MRTFASAVLVFLAAPSLAQPRQDSRVVRQAREEYTIQMAGTEDGANTRDPIVYNAVKAGFEPMRSVRIENTGDTDVVNPRIVVNGKRDWRTVADIVREALGTYGNPGDEAAKARAIWEFLRLHRFHATTGDMEVRDPVKMLNVYGFSLCGDNAAVLMELWRAAGLSARRGYPLGHCVAEAWYGGGWHMMDADESVLFLGRDNRTVLAESAVAHDPDLARRAYANDILPLLYNHDGTHTGDFAAHDGHTMDFTLRPGEAIEWRWGQGTKFHAAPPPVSYLIESADVHRWGANAWAALRNGRWTYRPRLDGAATHTWKVRTPYVLVGGSVSAPGASAISVSFDGRAWKPVPSDGSVDFLFPNPGEPRYEYFVRVDGAASAVSIENELQMAPMAMPELELGTNRVVYADDTAGLRSVLVTFDWTERSVSQPPAAPVRAGDLRWERVAGAVAYHFELADEPAMRWPLSPAFSAVQAATSFTPHSAGLLNAGQTYYWRVRAKSAAGIWGPWSAVWTFTPRGPSTPSDVRFEEREPERWTLVWQAKKGRYRIYGSDEKGFTPAEADFVAESDGEALRLDLRHAYYRVVAVDAEGRRSGPSDYVEAPRPWIYTAAPRTAKVGQPYRYEAKTVRSTGHRTYRFDAGKQDYVAGVWDADRPVFSIEAERPRCGGREAGWLRIDPKTGVVSGTPGEADVGEYQVNVRVEILGRAHVQSFPLRVER